MTVHQTIRVVHNILGEHCLRRGIMLMLLSQFNLSFRLLLMLLLLAIHPLPRQRVQKERVLFERLGDHAVVVMILVDLTLGQQNVWGIVVAAVMGGQWQRWLTRGGPARGKTEHRPHFQRRRITVFPG